MSSPLPPEILDLIADHMHDDITTLKTCCIVSKSWIPRTRKHLFARVEFHASRSQVELWKKTFPDPSNSPAHRTRHLYIRGLSFTTSTDAEVGDWIRTFQNVVRLDLEWLGPMNHKITLAPFHGLSPALRSLRLIATPMEVLDLICSFPLFEDLALIALSQGGDVWNTPSTSPKLTGSLELRAIGGIRSAARRLLNLPNGLHFTEITVACLDEDVESTTQLVSRCSGNLESFSVYYHNPAMSGTPPLDLSKATKLKYLSFRCGQPSIQRVTMALQTVQSKDLQKISIHPCSTFADLQLINFSPSGTSPSPVEGPVLQEWQDLDRLLVQFWNSHSIRPEITYEAGKGHNAWSVLSQTLLPEVTRRGLFDLVENKWWPRGKGNN